MIHLTKADPPPVLAKNAERWTEEYVGYITRGEVPPDGVRFCYRHRDIKTAITNETYSKCAYCEAKITANQPGQTDHILPVSKHPELICHWHNLTFVCVRCNHSKSDYDSPEAPLIDPYAVDPEQHILFYGPMAVWCAGDLLAMRTIRQLRLNRPELIEARTETLNAVLNILSLRATAPDDATRTVLANEALALAADDQQFAAAVRSYLRMCQPPPQLPEVG